ncbi:unnamed protein product, partial [Nesidiocoris tenuis]
MAKKVRQLCFILNGVTLNLQYCPRRTRSSPSKGAFGDKYTLQASAGRRHKKYYPVRPKIVLWKHIRQKYPLLLRLVGAECN